LRLQWGSEVKGDARKSGWGDDLDTSNATLIGGIIGEATLKLHSAPGTVSPGGSQEENVAKFWNTSQQGVFNC